MRSPQRPHALRGPHRGGEEDRRRLPQPVRVPTGRPSGFSCIRVVQPSPQTPQTSSPRKEAMSPSHRLPPRPWQPQIHAQSPWTCPSGHAMCTEPHTRGLLCLASPTWPDALKPICLARGRTSLLFTLNQVPAKGEPPAPLRAPAWALGCPSPAAAVAGAAPPSGRRLSPRS